MCGWIFIATILYTLEVWSKKANWFYDMLFLKDKDGNFLNFLITDDKEYNQLKEYFWQKFKINLDSVKQKFSAIYEIKKQDLKHF